MELPTKPVAEIRDSAVEFQDIGLASSLPNVKCRIRPDRDGRQDERLHLGRSAPFVEADDPAGVDTVRGDTRPLVRPQIRRRETELPAALSSRQVIGRVGAAATGGFATGVEVTATFDEKNYVGTGVFLVASVLERFLGQYASINSFTQLVAKTMQGEGVLKKWPPRVGELPVL